MKKVNCLLTGASGILGSHILFEWIRKAVVEQTVNHLFVVIRDTEKSAQARLIDILQDDSRPEFLNDISLHTCLEKLTVIAQDLSSLNQQDFSTI